MEALATLSPYHPALLALAVLCFIVLVQGFLTAPLAFVSEAQQPGMPLQGDHNQLSFRAIRTYANSTESLPMFGFALITAIILGASASLVNWLAGIHLVFRIAFWLVYYSGVGKVAGGPRTLCYVGGLVSNLVLAGAAVWAYLS